MDRSENRNALGISREIFAFGETICEDLQEEFAAIDRTAEHNQWKVLAAMQAQRVSEACLHPSTGYGYNDIGRDTLERVYADVFGAEAALVRAQITCGTHAIALALAGNLCPGDVLYSPSGSPYDTMEEVIGIREQEGSLAELGVRYLQTELREDGSFDFDAIRAVLSREPVKLAMIQRSRGYQTRPSFFVDEIGELIREIKKISPDTICFVDNCYGEFVEEREPTEAGADLMAGSLIKNPGGGLAPCGGYIVGREELVRRAAFRLTAPGLGAEVGASLGANQTFFQGFFLAPVVTAAAVKGAIFAARLYGALGFPVYPGKEEKRTDIIQAVTLGSKEGLLAFCRGIQAAAPVDSFVTPEPWPMPGYDAEVVMAAGAFVSGSSIELSADGPLVPPYNVYMQGGLTWPHAKAGILRSLQELSDAGLVDLPAGRLS